MKILATTISAAAILVALSGCAYDRYDRSGYYDNDRGTYGYNYNRDRDRDRDRYNNRDRDFDRDRDRDGDRY